MGTPTLGLVQCSGSAGVHATALNGLVTMAPQRSFGVFSTPANAINNAACDTTRDVLLKAGWNLRASVPATGILVAPLGWGATGFLRLACTVGTATEGTAYQFYDPRYEDAPSGYMGGFVIWPVQCGSSSPAAQTNLANAITDGGLVRGEITDANTITLTARSPGTLGNGIVIGGGAATIGSVLSGGGWELQSRPQLEFEKEGNAASFILAVRTGAPGQGNVQLNITVGADTLNYYVAQASWYLIANTYSACFYGMAGYHAGDIYVYNTFIWLCAPAVPSDPPVPVSYAAFVAQGSEFTQSLGASGTGNQVDMWVNGSHVMSGQDQRGWSMVMIHNEGQGILDPVGNGILQPALVMMNPGATESRIIGYISDAFISSLPATPPEQHDESGQRYRCIASQTVVPGSLYLATGETAGEPARTPTPAAGSTGTYAAGTANVFGDLLIWVSGPKFDASMVGKTLSVGGAQYTIEFYTSPNQLIFSPVAGTNATDAAYTIAL